VHIPDPARVMETLYSENLLQGRVREVSRGRGETFAVVDVEGIPTPVLIAVDRILGVL
jgi:multidrug resistance efflux pump